MAVETPKHESDLVRSMMEQSGAGDSSGLENGHLYPNSCIHGRIDVLYSDVPPELE